MSDLFRQPAIEASRRKIFGHVTIHQPVAFGYITTFIVVAVAASIILAATASFAKSETALGWIVPEGGMAQVYAPQGARVENVLVHVGEEVTKGQVLATLSTDTFDAVGATGDRERQQIDNQLQELDAQISASRNRLTVSLERSRKQISAFQTGSQLLSEQRRLQLEQLEVAQRQYDEAAPLVAKAYISKFDQDRRLQAILGLRQGISGLDRQIRDQGAEIESAQSDMADAAARQAAEEAQLRSSKAALNANRIQLDFRTGATLRAPVAGVIASINSRAGETVQPALAVISIAPPGKMGAELLLPTRAAGLVQSGQRVRLFVDAFPYQRYGAIEGVVEQVSRAAVSPTEYSAPIVFKEASYRVRIRLVKGLPIIDGTAPRVQVGMTLTASIIADKRTILQWLIDPLRSR